MEPGDIVVFGTSHIGIISDKRNKKGIPYLIHNGGQPLREEDILELYNQYENISGHFRIKDTNWKSLYFFRYIYTTNRSVSNIMSVKEFKSKLKEYFDRKMYEEIQKTYGEPQYDLSEEDVRKLLYFIKFSDEIISEYGSLERWEKVLNKSGLKPYLYYDFKE